MRLANIGLAARGLLNLLMLIAVAGIALAVYYHAPSDVPKSASEKLVPVAQSDVRTVEIARIDVPLIKLHRADAEWRMLLPVEARLDETALARVLELSRLRATDRLPADAPARYGLDKPWATVHIEGHLLEFGNSNPVTEEVYVRSGGAVYVVPARTATAIPGTPARLIAHRMFASDEIPVSIRLEGFRLHHDGTRWRMEPSVGHPSQDDLIRWVEQWRYASSITTQPGTAPGKIDVVVALGNGREIEFGIKTRTPDLVLHRRDERLDYHFNAGTASMLLQPPSSAELPLAR